MRVEARFPYALWPEIGKTVVYLYNRTLNYGDSDTRWESFYIRFFAELLASLEVCLTQKRQKNGLIRRIWWRLAAKRTL
jgi:hypothetical protein